jgi:hypothetical protein
MELSHSTLVWGSVYMTAKHTIKEVVIAESLLQYNNIVLNSIIYGLTYL